MFKKGIHKELTAENIISRCNIEVRHGSPAQNIIEVAENSPIPVLLVPAENSVKII